MEKPKRKLVERPITNKFVRAISPKRSIINMLSFKHSKTDYLHSITCRIRWSEGTRTRKNAFKILGMTYVCGSFSPNVNISSVKVIPLLEVRIFLYKRLKF